MRNVMTMIKMLVSGIWDHIEGDVGYRNWQCSMILLKVVVLIKKLLFTCHFVASKRGYCSILDTYHRSSHALECNFLTRG